MRHRSYPWATDFGLILQGCPLGQTRTFRNPLISEYMTSIDILRNDLQRASVVIVFHNEVRSFTFLYRVCVDSMTGGTFAKKLVFS
jgi:hypothetical protein